MDADRRRAWDARHRAELDAGTPSLFVVDALTALAAPASPLAPGRALDLACGRGRHALLLAARGWQVDAVDYSLPALAALRHAATRKGLDVRCLATDVSTWAMPRARYDLVVVVSFLDRGILPAIRDAVAPGGALVYETQLRENESSAGMRPEFRLAPGELELLCAGWDVVLRRDDRTMHRGQPALRAGIAARRPAARH